MGTDAPTTVTLPVRCAPKKAPCPTCGKHGCRKRRLPPRLVRTVAYKAIVYLEMSCPLCSMAWRLGKLPSTTSCRDLIVSQARRRLDSWLRRIPDLQTVRSASLGYSAKRAPDSKGIRGFGLGGGTKGT